MSTNKYYRVEEKFQAKARLRRLGQQMRDGKFETLDAYQAAVASVHEDYAKRHDMPLFIDAAYTDVEEK